MVKRVFRAIEKNEKVVVYGDYDADGVTSSALLFDLFKSLGLEPTIYIPYREEEGYGLNLGAVKKFHDEKVDLVVTVDCGITSVAEAKALKKYKIDLIIIDHHEPLSEVPSALAIINPKIKNENYPYKHLSGCGLAFKVAQALLEPANRDKYKSISFPTIGYEKWLLDLVAISSVADMVPLIDENRIFVKYGLIVLQKTKRIGLQTLLKTVNGKSNLNSQSIGFQIAPRLNAAGRLNHASTAYKLLVTDDPAEAIKINNELHDTNTERQRLTEKTFSLALEQNKDSGRDLLIAKDKEWKIGIVGLVAGRLADRQKKPAIVMGKNLRGQWIGSGRSIPGFDITHALEKLSKYLDRFGGHEQACGFTIKKGKSVKLFQDDMNELVSEFIKSGKQKPTIMVDCVATLKQLNWKIVNQIQKFQPFGVGNSEPKFLIRGLRVSRLSHVGKSNQHVRIVVEDKPNKILRKAIAFNHKNNFELLVIGDTIDIVVEVDVNEWNGNKEIQLKIIDVKKNES